MALSPKILPGHEPLVESLREGLAGHQSLAQDQQQQQRNNWDHLLALGDAELLAQIQGQREDNRFEVPPHLIPDGMTYAWCRTEVAGQPDYRNIARWQAAGWQAVPQKRHDGWWMPPGTEGPTRAEGSMLMEIPTRIYEVKVYAAQKTSREPIEGLKDRLAYGASPGSAPRDAHPQTRPQIRHTVVSGNEFEIAP